MDHFPYILSRVRLVDLNFEFVNWLHCRILKGFVEKLFC